MKYVIRSIDVTILILYQIIKYIHIKTCRLIDSREFLSNDKDM